MEMMRPIIVTVPDVLSIIFLPFLMAKKSLIYPPFLVIVILLLKWSESVPAYEPV